MSIAAKQFVKVKTKLAGVVKAEVIRENAASWIVRLPDGNIVRRHKIKHLAPSPPHE